MPKMPKPAPFAAAALAAALALAACSKPAAIECPTPQMRGADGVLADSSADIAAYGARLREGYGANALAEAVAAVRAQYPGATASEVQNFLIAAYCPVARQSAPDAAGQAASLARFETALAATLGQ